MISISFQYQLCLSDLHQSYAYQGDLESSMCVSQHKHKTDMFITLKSSFTQSRKMAGLKNWSWCLLYVQIYLEICSITKRLQPSVAL